MPASSSQPTPDDAPNSNNPQDYVTPPFLVAAVGASTGGLEAFSKLLGAMPSNAPLALVLVQRMSRTQPSLLPEILATRTALRVVQAADATKIESGCAYVISPDTHMTVIDGHLRVRPRPAGNRSVQADALHAPSSHRHGRGRQGAVCPGNQRRIAAACQLVTLQEQSAGCAQRVVMGSPSPLPT